MSILAWRANAAWMRGDSECDTGCPISANREGAMSSLVGMTGISDGGAPWRIPLPEMSVLAGSLSAGMGTLVQNATCMSRNDAA
jgi:hypothetical protein